MNKLKVAILGAGPSAAFAYQACKAHAERVDVEVFSAEASKIPVGAFWFRWLPHNIRSQLRSQSIFTNYVGTEDLYVSKQWGDSVSVTGNSSSFPKELVGVQQGFKPEEAIPLLWDDVIFVLGQPFTDTDTTKLALEVDIVLQTFPTDESKEENKDKLTHFPLVTFDDVDHKTNIVTYNGSKGDTVRFSQLFGKVHFEYVPNHIIDGRTLGDSGSVRTVMDIHPDTIPWESDRTPAKNVHLLGRYAEWTRHKLSHDAYNDTVTILEKYLL